MPVSQQPTHDATVAVFGANGHTGRFVVAELERRGIEPIVVGRDGARLAGCGYAERGIEARRASVDDVRSLDRAFAGATAVINCAGPFLDTADAVAAAALRARAHYLDVTAEQASARATLDRFDAPARAAGLLVVPAMGFYGGFIDLLVTAALADWVSADEIRVAIALDSWHPTPGTRLTGTRNTVPRVFVSRGQLVPAPQPAAETEWEFQEPFGRQRVVELPFSEIILITRHIRTAELHTYLSRTALDDIRDPATPPPEAVDASGRSTQRFRVEASVVRGGQTRRVAAQGRDIYAFTAPLVCEAVQRILDGRASGSGAFAPGALFNAADFLAATDSALYR